MICAAVVALTLVGAVSVPAAAATPGQITIVAGTGVTGYTGDGGPAIAARLNGPRTIAIDALGNLYISDCVNHAIRKVEPSGRISTLAGTGRPGYTGDGGPGTAAELYYPHDVATDPSGNVLIADSRNHTIRKVDPAGTITTLAGTGKGGFSGDGGPATDAQLSHPKGVAADRSGNVYIGDTNNNRIRKVDRSGTITTVAGDGGEGYGGDGGPATRASLNRPRGIVLDETGNLYIADRYNFRIRRVDPAGIIATIAGTGKRGFSGDGGPAVSARIDDVHGNIALDPAGSLYIPDSGNHRVRRIDPSGIVTTVAGTGDGGFSGDGGPATNARLQGPRGAAVDAQGNLYVAEPANDVVRRVAVIAAPSQGGPAAPAPPDRASTEERSSVGPGGYWLVSRDGGVFSFGDAVFKGAPAGRQPTPDMAAIAPTATRNGYWLATQGGNVVAFGDAQPHGTVGSAGAHPIVGIAPTPSGQGYWLVASDGGVFSFGDAAFRGSTGAIKLAQPIIGIAPTPSGQGYWLVASDGGVFSFGDAAFRGSTGAIKLAQPIIGMAVS